MASTSHLNTLGKIGNYNLKFLLDAPKTVIIIGWELCRDMHQDLKCLQTQIHDLQLTAASEGNDNVQGWITISYNIWETVYQFMTLITKTVSYPIIVG